jgi:hypothetical protein
MVYSEVYSDAERRVLLAMRKAIAEKARELTGSSIGPQVIPRRAKTLDAGEIQRHFALSKATYMPRCEN